MTFQAAEDFKKNVKYHILGSLLLFVFFGVGFHHSRNTDWSGTAPYWVFGAIGGAMQFIAALACTNVYLKRSSETEMLKATCLYRLFLFFMMIWGFAGTVATGVTGACPDLEDCAYQENQGVNKAMAICILVLHILTFIYCIFTMEDAEKFAANKGTAVHVAPQPKPNSSVERPYDADTTVSGKPEPPFYRNPLPTTYNILPPPSQNLPPPPSYESIMAGGAHPTPMRLEPIAPRPVQPKSLTRKNST